MTWSARRRENSAHAFTLLELLVVISIISLLMSILLPSLSRARDQAKGVHCLARLKEFGNALSTYENTGLGRLPPAQWHPTESDLQRGAAGDGASGGSIGGEGVSYGWMEILFPYVYGDAVRLPRDYPVQRNIDGRRWQEYFLCRAVGDAGISAGHYRVYLPAWSTGSFSLESGGVYGDNTRADPYHPSNRERIRPTLPLIGDANERSERGDGLGADECSYIDGGEADFAGSDGRTNGNRFSDRHYGGTNYLFGDLHAAWDTQLRAELARDYDLNGIIDIERAP